MDIIDNKNNNLDQTICPACKGWGQVKFDEGEFLVCNKCKGKGELKTLTLLDKHIHKPNKNESSNNK